MLVMVISMLATVLSSCKEQESIPEQSHVAEILEQESMKE